MSFDITTLPDLIQEQLYKWDEHIRADHTQDGIYRPRGLWVQGDRGEGSSFVARGAYVHAESLVDRPFGTEAFNSVVDARDLTEMVRERWSLDQSVRQHPNDTDLWSQSNRLDLRLDWLLSVSPVTFVDNLYSANYDIGFWNRHIWPAFDGKIKKGKAVVVATDLSVKDVIGSHWQNLYTGCPAVLPAHAER